MNRYQAIRLRLFLALITLCLGACTTHRPNATRPSAPLPNFNSSLFSNNVSVVEPTAVTVLNDEARADFFAFFNNPKFSMTPANERLASYLGMMMEQFTYSKHTYTAQETYDNRSGNCLSLSLLTIAYAELAGINTELQLLGGNPTYEIEEGVLITSEHLRTLLWPSVDPHGGRRMFRKRIVIDFFDTDGLKYIGDISSDSHRSMYFSNRAAELLTETRYDDAFAHAHRSLNVDPTNAAALNTMAVLHRRMGDPGAAERLFEYGIKYSDRSLTFWRNYAQLLESENRVEELEQLLAAAPSSDNGHPWQWIKAARRAHRDGEFTKAITFYNRALKVAPKMHQLHVYIAAAHLAEGNLRRSRFHVSQAISIVEEPADRTRYLDKLAMLEHHVGTRR